MDRSLVSYSLRVLAACGSGADGLPATHICRQHNGLTRMRTTRSLNIRSRKFGHELPRNRFRRESDERLGGGRRLQQHRRIGTSTTADAVDVSAYQSGPANGLSKAAVCRRSHLYDPKSRVQYRHIACGCIRRERFSMARNGGFSTRRSTEFRSSTLLTCSRGRRKNVAVAEQFSAQRRRPREDHDHLQGNGQQSVDRRHRSTRADGAAVTGSGPDTVADGESQSDTDRTAGASGSLPNTYVQSSAVRVRCWKRSEPDLWIPDIAVDAFEH